MVDSSLIISPLVTTILSHAKVDSYTPRKSHGAIKGADAFPNGHYTDGTPTRKAHGSNVARGRFLPGEEVADAEVVDLRKNPEMCVFGCDIVKSSCY